ncbi:hypothetical protein J2S44_007869 [Catenuloplanes niger]|uniref:Uncharacterized protein n=1 Tax=Catenuloplanes niger TaxID=587534 RepID=A0AAE3ZX06_9ACTN|nr:hypothetical protein [Catenuloplanes niger]
MKRKLVTLRRRHRAPSLIVLVATLWIVLIVVLVTVQPVPAPK